MNNRKRMIARVYRKNPELVLHKCAANLAGINSVSETFRRFSEAAIACAKAICEAFNKPDLSKLIESLPSEEE